VKGKGEFMQMEELRGAVFDIRRFSTHDGHGIRTTVFLKGCPLSCVWCHNPEGIHVTSRPLFFPNKCIKCGTCIALSKHGGVTYSGDGIVLSVNREENWHQIVEACPADALVWDSKTMSVTEVVEQVLRDRPFYRQDGGVTLSGGEPLLQPEFALELLKQLKAQGIHTAIETALHVPEAVLAAVIPYLDLIYADFKVYDSDLHKTYTGMPNEQIKKNIRTLLTSEKRAWVIIRTPLIPGLTADEANIKAISQYISGIYDEVSYELLNYNPLAEAKYHLIDQTYYFAKNPERYSTQKMLQFADIARAGGVKHVIIES